MLKRVKKLYSKSKRNKNKFPDEDNNNNDGVECCENTLGSSSHQFYISRSSHNVAALLENNNNIIINNNNHIHDCVTLRSKAKKHKSSIKNKLKEDRNNLSRSTGNLLHLSMQTNPKPSSPINIARNDSVPDRLRERDSSSSRRKNSRNSLAASQCKENCSASRRNSTFSQSSRSSMVTSPESLRESRISVISKLDEYIDCYKKSVEDEKIPYAPNRLLCANLLKMVYQKREQECLYRSLHHNNSLSPLSDRRLHGISQSRSFGNLRKSPKTTRDDITYGSAHNLRPASSVSHDLNGGKVRWKQGTDSESSSTSGEFQTIEEAEQRMEGFSLESKNGVNAANKNKNNMNSPCGAEVNECGCLSDVRNENSDSNYEQNNVIGSYGGLDNCSSRKSVPLFPQNFDIF